MKRAICICLLSSIVLTGCISKADYEQLEERVSKLEQEQSRINESTTTTPETSAVADPSISESDTEASNQKSSTNYSIEGLSAEEIYAECKSIYQTIAGSSGITKEEFMDLYDSSPDYLPFVFDGFDDDTINDCIISIRSDGITEQMDGTIICSENLLVTICLRLSDYKTAEAFYNIVVSEASSNEKYKDYVISNYQEGTNWSASVNSADGWTYRQIINLEKRNNSYYIRIDIVDV